MLSFKHRGNFELTKRFLQKVRHVDYGPILEKYAKEGVDALEAATPKETGITANSWGYEITQNDTRYTIYWTNSHLAEGYPIVLLVQYGHATRGGTYIQGRDFINPAIRPIFDEIAKNLWKEVIDS